MKKKALIITIAFIVSLCCFGCGKENKSSDNDKYKTVVFYNYDGTVLYNTEYKIGSGEELVYAGPEPTKPSDKEHNYTFSSWDHDLSEVDKYSIFHALFEESFKEFTITFYNEDNSFFYSTTAKYGENIYEKNIPTPTKSSDSQRQQYVFSKWDSDELSYVTRDLEIHPIFELYNFYLVTYLNADNSFVQSVYVQEGENAPITLIPSLEIDDDTKILVFDHWGGDYVNIQHDVTLTAVYSTKRAYIVTFYSYDNATIYKRVKVVEGGNVTCPGVNKPNTSTTYYVFDHWSVSLTNIYFNLSAYPVYKEYTAAEYLMLFLENNTYDTILSSWRTLTIYPSDWETGHVKFGYCPGDNKSLIIWAVFFDSYGYSYEMTYIFTSQQLSSGTGTITYDAHMHTYSSPDAGYNQYYDAGLTFRAYSNYHAVSQVVALSSESNPNLDQNKIGTQMNNVVTTAINSVNIYLLYENMPFAF